MDRHDSGAVDEVPGSTGLIDQCGLDPGPRDALASQHQPSRPLRRRGEWSRPPVLDQHDEADCARQEAGGSQGDVVLAQQPIELTGDHHVWQRLGGFWLENLYLMITATPGHDDEIENPDGCCLDQLGKRGRDAPERGHLGHDNDEALDQRCVDAPRVHSSRRTHPGGACPRVIPPWSRIVGWASITPGGVMPDACPRRGQPPRRAAEVSWCRAHRRPVPGRQP